MPKFDEVKIARDALDRIEESTCKLTQKQQLDVMSTLRGMIDGSIEALEEEIEDAEG